MFHNVQVTSGVVLFINLKDAMPVSFRSELFHYYIKPYLSSENFSRKYEKLPNKVIHGCKNITEKINLLKICGHHIQLCLFMV